MPPKASTSSSKSGGSGPSKRGPGKTKGGPSAPKALTWILPRSIPQPEHNHTLSHLVQVSSYFSFLASLIASSSTSSSSSSSIPSTSDEATKRQQRRKAALQSLSSRYSRDTLSLSRKAVLRLDVDVKRGICRCGLVRMGMGWKCKRNGPHGKVVMQRCICGSRKRWPAKRAWPTDEMVEEVRQKCKQMVSVQVEGKDKGKHKMTSMSGAKKGQSTVESTPSSTATTTVETIPQPTPTAMGKRKRSTPSSTGPSASFGPSKSTKPCLHQARPDTHAAHAGAKEPNADLSTPRRKLILRKQAEASVGRRLSQRQRRKQAKLYHLEAQAIVKKSNKTDRWVNEFNERRQMRMSRREFARILALHRAEGGREGQTHPSRQREGERPKRPKERMSRKARKVERAERIARREAKLVPNPGETKTTTETNTTSRIVSGASAHLKPSTPALPPYAQRVEGSGWDRPVVSLRQAAQRDFQQQVVQDDTANFALHAAHFYESATRMRGGHVVVHGIGKGGAIGSHQG